MTTTNPTTPLSGEPAPQRHVCIVGAGYSGLAAAYELVRRGVRVTLIEADTQVGGLAGSFDVGGYRLEKFYHHWFTNDLHVLQLIHELGLDDQIERNPTRTGMYYAKHFFRLSSPVDVLKFKPLRLIDRIRLGLLVLKVRKVKDWHELESLTAAEWLLKLAGPEVYRVVWEPLLRGKFGPYATEVSAVWMWSKLKLRGGSRGKGAAEVLMYFRGGFDALAQKLAADVVGRGTTILTGTTADALITRAGRVTGVRTSKGVIEADAVIATPALPIVAGLLEGHLPPEYLTQLRKIEYLANICLVLILDRSLSQTYWLNVNDPTFPYVGVIEHTNFEGPQAYGGRHVVYLSKYLPPSDAMYPMSDEEILHFSLPHLKRMFPEFDEKWIMESHVWRARYAQPIMVRHYSEMIPPPRTPLDGFYITGMAHVYPEDRGTNYAIREGRQLARTVADSLGV